MYSRSYSWTLLGTVWLGLAQNHEYIKSLTLCSSRSLYKSYGKIILEAKSSLDILFGPRSNFFWYTSITRNGAPCSSHWRSCKEGSKHHNIRGLMKGKYFDLPICYGVCQNSLPCVPVTLFLVLSNRICSVLSKWEILIKMRAAFLALSFLHNSREDGGRKGSSHFDEKLSFW